MDIDLWTKFGKILNDKGKNCDHIMKPSWHEWSYMFMDENVIEFHLAGQ